MPDQPIRPPDLLQPQIHAVTMKFWRRNVQVMLVLLTIWFAAGLGCGVLWAQRLNELELHGKPIRMGGFPLGFWFAQQGSILIFVGLILVYAIVLNHLDREHHREITELRRQREA